MPQDALRYLVSAQTLGTNANFTSTVMDLVTTPGSPRRGYCWTFNSTSVLNASASAGTVTWTQIGGSDTGFTNAGNITTLIAFAITVGPTSTTGPYEKTFKTINNQEFEKGVLGAGVNVTLTGLNVQMTAGVYEG
jgi:hypothetical protein